MEQKLTLADLASGLSRRASVPMRYSEDFVRSFFKLIEEGLMHDNIVKIKGLGTFKLVGVDARESINVNTGERFEIAGHTKVNFTPDSALRDCVNKPFLEFETVILNEGTDTSKMEAVDDESLLQYEESEQTLERSEDEKYIPESESQNVVPLVEQPQYDIVDDIASDEGEADEGEAENEGSVIENPSEETQASQDSSITNDISAVSSSEEENSVEASPKEDAPLDKEQTALSSRNDEHSGLSADKDRSSSGSCVLCYIFTIILSLILGYVIAYYWRPIELPEVKPADDKCPSVIEKQEPKKAKETPIAPKKEAKTDDNMEVKQAEQATKSKQPSETLAYPQVEDGEFWIVGVEGTEVMTPGKTLLNISIKYYKSKDFVNYICTMNDIKNPDIVPLNKELRIPKLKKK